MPHGDRKPAGALTPAAHAYREERGNCGPAALRIALRQHGTDVPEGTLARAAGTTSDGTRPEGIAAAAEVAGHRAHVVDHMPVGQLKKLTDEGHPVITAYQDGRPDSDANGHYSVVGKVDDAVHMSDPSSKKPLREVPLDEFVSRWHDVDADGREREHLGVVIKKAGQLLPAKGEFAPGIPSSRTIHPLPPVPRGQPQQWHVATQEHHAEKAGKHVDLRLVDPEGKAHSWVLPETGLPKPGEKFYLPQTFTHTKDYAERKGAFDIPEGYGKGKVVGSGLRPADVHYSEPGKLRFSLLEGRNPQDYILIDTPKGWVIHNFSPTAEAGVRGSKGFEIPQFKPKYRESKIKALSLDNPNEVLQAKIDGAHATIHIPNKDSQVRVFSYRPTESGTGVIEYTHKLPDYHTLRAPGSLAGTVLRGELWAADSKGQALPAERIGGILNASVDRSRQLQEQHGRLRPAIFDVVRYKGRPMADAPYSEKLKVLREVAKEMPQFELPPTAETPEEKIRLFSRIQGGKEPTTKEGLVAWHLEHPTPTKFKFRPDVDAEVVDVFPGKGKHEGRAGGLVVKLPGAEATTRVGTGFSDQMRKELWEQRQEVVGRVAKVEAQQVFPSGKLRGPAFKEFHLEKGKQASVMLAALRSELNRISHG